MAESTNLVEQSPYVTSCATPINYWSVYWNINKKYKNHHSSDFQVIWQTNQI